MLRRRRSRLGVRAVAGIVAAILLLGLTVVGGAILWALQFNLPTSSIQVEYTAEGGLSVPAWSDPTDCHYNVGANATCDPLPAIYVIFTSHSPTDIQLSALGFRFMCNGTTLLSGSFSALEIVPGTGSNPAAGSPTLGNCGTWAPSPNGFHATFFNRLTYFQQLQVGKTTLTDGDLMVIYVHPASTFCDSTNHCPDDDYHGAPPWCFTVPGACVAYITYSQTPVTLVATVPIINLAGT